ncbi:high-temperature-induced dauer-formation protein-domain-containing protein [Irpex rosettiformis]|uniref:High-temperature-induced dauer-formation protein-domain-containing protein n=1 Tax=Irpex rosettiformis TaxID=378272 RepID=A0ACB8TPK6_9APHY|nr:high-temperature-induced dauer-formation protein-domain-containing protein [Irpex rosettiformis]
MFAKLPQKLPFNLLGDEAKLAFRSRQGGIAKLAVARNISETDSYWDQYFVLFDTASDVFTLISPHDVRLALIDAPENVATLLRVVMKRLFNLVSDHTFPTAANTSVTSFATSFIKSSAGSNERNATKEVLNCLRLLQRVLPVVFELDMDASRLELEVFWKREVVEEEVVHDVESSAAQFVIEDEEDEEDAPPAPASAASGQPRSSTSPTKTQKTLPSLAERLMSCLVDLLFCCGFTLPSKIQVDHHKINYTIWEKGIGTTVDLAPTQAIESNRTEVLRTLLVLFSKQTYAPPSALFTSPSLYTLHFVQHTPRRNVLTVLCSLLNSAMNASRGNGHNIIGGVTGKLPYNHLVFKGEDTKTSLTGMCFAALCVLLDFQSGSARDVPSQDGETSQPTAKTNSFRYFVAKLHRSNDFAFILQGVISIFEEQMASIHNLLPGSRKSVPYIVETVVFFWKMVELNKKFRTYVLDSEKATDILAYLLCYGLEIKDKPEQHGLCRVVSYIVQSMSAEHAFGTKLSSTIKVTLPPKANFLGNAGDFLINAVYAMIATTSGTLNSLYPALVIALSNAAPYFKNLSINSSARLMQLFTAFANPSFLLSDEGHPRLMFFMLEVFNGILLRNLSDNPNVVYNIVRHHKTFEDLGTFTLARGLREIRRVQLAKENREKGGDATRKSSTETPESEEPRDEKARLARSESLASLELSRSGSGQDDLEAQRNAPSEEDVRTGRPLMSPSLSTDASFPEGQRSGPSEKARGKMRAGRSMSDDMTGSLERLAASGVGRNGFVPTQEWVTSWQQGLPLDTIMIVTSELYPKIQELQSSLSGPTANTAIVDLLRSANLEEHLPRLASLNPRRFVWTDASIIWLTSLIWGEIYVRGMTPFGIWNSTSVRLFYVKHTQQPQRQITETVSNVVGGLLGRTESSQSIRQRA